MRTGALAFALLATGVVPAMAQTPADWTVAGGAGRLVAERGPWLGHVRGGPEWVPEEGFGFSVDGGWLWFGPDLRNGGGSASPSLVYSLGGPGSTTTSLRAGYTVLFGEGTAHAAHAGLTLDRDLGDEKRLRLEVRDTFIPSVFSLHVLELTVGFVFPG